MNNHLEAVNNWLICNKLSLNIEKSSFIIFHPPQKKLNHCISLQINGKALKYDSQIKYLGITIDSNLNWKGHINHIITKVRRNIGILSKLRYFVNITILTQLYYSLIFPYLTYGLITWGNTYPSTLKPIVILQKKAIRIISSVKYDEHTSPLFKKLNILKFSDLITLYNSLFMYDFSTGNLPQVFNDFFVQINKIHNYNTRLASKKSYYTPPVRTNYGKFSIRFNGVKIWNSIDELYKHLSRSKFKQQLKFKMIDCY